MHVLLTDSLTCPRCGPEFPLVLLADRVENRRVYEGQLGCPNCRERFGVHDGFGDLRFGTAGAGEALDDVDSEDTLRLAAMLGVTEGPASVLLAGPVAAHAAALADMIPQLEVIAAHPLLAEAIEREGVSRLAVSDQLPFRDRSMRGVSLSGVHASDQIEEAARVLMLRARLVLRDVDDAARERLAASGLTVLASDGRAVVAERTRI